MGHKKPLTTITSYGHIEPHRQRDLIRKLGAPQLDADRDELEAALVIVRMARQAAKAAHQAKE
jgi:hypothetical protein